jgi:hypothetical protein
MKTLDEPEPIKTNLKEIRNYLQNEFPGYIFTEDSSYPTFYHKFAMTNDKLHRCYKLQVSWFRLTENGNPSATIRSMLNRDDVADQMLQADGHYFCW